MSLHRTFAIFRRLMAGFRRDRRTLALLFVAPIVLLTLFYYLLRGGGPPPAMGVVLGSAPSPQAAALAAALQRSTQVDATLMDETTAAAKLAGGDIAGYVVLPGPGQQLVVRLEGTQPADSEAVLRAVQLAAAPAAVTAAVRVEYLHGGPALETFDRFGGAFIGVVLYFLVFVITSVAFLRERSQGTLERLMASPLRRLDIVIGYLLAFTVLGLVQGAEVLLFSLGVLHMYNAGGIALIFGIEAILALAAVGLGIFLSMFAQSEFQAVQFIPLVIVPQVLLAGLLVPVSSEPGLLRLLSALLPLTYAVDALRSVMLKGAGLESPAVRTDIAVLAAFALAMLPLALATLRRRLA